MEVEVCFVPLEIETDEGVDMHEPVRKEVVAGERAEREGQAFETLPERGHPQQRKGVEMLEDLELSREEVHPCV